MVWALTLEGLSLSKEGAPMLQLFVDVVAYCAEKERAQTHSGDDGPCTVTEQELAAAWHDSGKEQAPDREATSLALSRTQNGRFLFADLVA